MPTDDRNHRRAAARVEGRTDARWSPSLAASLLLCTGLLAACGTVQTPQPAAAQPRVARPVLSEPLPLPEALPLPPPVAGPAQAWGQPPSAPAQADSVEGLLAFADRVRSLSPADRAREIAAVGTAPASPADAGQKPARQLQLAIALAQTRAPADLARAQQLAQHVADSENPEAQPLKALARLLATRLTEQRQLEDQLERLAQQSRDQQRRIDQLSARLEAVRAIERSMTPPKAPSNAAPAQPPNGAASAPK